MAVTQIVVIISVASIAMILSLVVGTWGGKNDNMRAPAIVVFGLVIPICFSLVYIALSSFIISMGWMDGFFVPLQELAVFAISWIGGYIGLRVGDIWHREDDPSCFKSMLIYFCLVIVGSLVYFLLS